MEHGITKNEIITALTRSPHGALAEYLPVGKRAASEEPEFFAHLLVWNLNKGKIRDSKVALPVLALNGTRIPEFRSNALANMAKLNPRELLRAFQFLPVAGVKGANRRAVWQMIRRYLRNLESNRGKWERVALQHRHSMRSLYAATATACPDFVNQILFDRRYPPNSLFAAVAGLRNMTPQEAAGTILERRIPFLIAAGAMGAKMKNPDVLLALIDRMTATELVTNMKMLSKFGADKIPALRAALAKATERAAGSQQNLLKTTAAAEAAEDETTQVALRELQERQMRAAQGIEGNWLVLGDKSGSMSSALGVAKQIAALLAKMVKGKVALVFFDTAPRWIDVTGLTYEEIKEKTKHVTASGGTSIGCGLLAAIEHKMEIDGIAVVSDGGENTAPFFYDQYAAYSQASGKQVPVYLYRLPGDSPDIFSRSLTAKGIDCQVFDLGRGVDYYSLPNLVNTMRSNRYSLIEEIMEAPLLQLDLVLPPARMEALAV